MKLQAKPNKIRLVNAALEKIDHCVAAVESCEGELTKDGYRTFERDINVFNGFELKVTLEVTEEGLRKLRAKEDIELDRSERESDVRAQDAESYKTNKEGDAIESLSKKGQGFVESRI